MKRSLTIVSLALGLITVIGCGHQPRTIVSTWDITWTPTSEYMISVIDLPLRDYPRLQKFRGLEHLHLSGEDRPITDQEVQAISRLQFPRLRQVYLIQCREVTDEGVQSLTNVPSIEGLHLRGVSITDRGMLIIATCFPKLKGVNVEQCHSLTAAGFLNLTNSATINEVVMAKNAYSQQEIEMIMATVTNVTWWGISDPHHQLDLDSLRQVGDAKRHTIQVIDENNAVRTITKVQQTH